MLYYFFKSKIKINVLLIRVFIEIVFCVNCVNFIWKFLCYYFFSLCFRNIVCWFINVKYILICYKFYLKNNCLCEK